MTAGMEAAPDRAAERILSMTCLKGAIRPWASVVSPAIIPVFPYQ
ncbi:hypothetical protein [Roseomonas marmotae]|nr:hypothetical protein [Roseomonas marmotae]